MDLALQSGNFLQMRLRESVLKDFLPVSTRSFPRGARRVGCDLSRVGSGISKVDVNAGRHGSTFESREVRKEAGYLLSLTARRSAAKGKLVCNAAASSPGAHADFNSVTLLGRAFLQKDVQFVCAAVATVLLAGANKILYKMALVPLSAYPLFLAQFNTIAYVFAYSSILLLRYRAGIVTKEMLAIPKGKFVAIGALEALGLAMGMASAALLPGATIPVLAQVFPKFIP
jgi:hypothetical protein